MNKEESFHIFDTAWGFAAIAFKNDAATAFFLPEKSIAQIRKRVLQARPGIAEKRTLPPGIAGAIEQIQKYFAGESHSFKKIKTDLSETSEFARQVYLQLQKIAAGHTTSYKSLATACSRPTASRAVGRIVGANPLPLLIPCHRVVGSDGNLGGFSATGGTKTKAKMLLHEDIPVSSEPPYRLKTPDRLDEIDKDAAIKHLCQVDKELGQFIKQAPQFNLKCDNLASPFQALLEAIVYQQLTGKAAATIFKRLLDLFSAAGSVSPLDIIRASDEELRSAGLSGAKIAAARDLADFAISGRLPDLKSLQRMPDHEIISILTQIRGIGRWTVEMLLIFKLGRTDVMAADDYGLRKGLAVIRKHPQNLPTAKELIQQSLLWRPFRSIAAWYLWRAAETTK